MKQTAVEQFIEQLEKQGDSWENASMGTINISIKVEDYLQLKKQAKEMEKERMIEFAREVLIEAYATFEGNVTTELTIEQYYEQTQGGDK